MIPPILKRRVVICYGRSHICLYGAVPRTYYYVVLEIVVCSYPCLLFSKKSSKKAVPPTGGHTELRASGP